MMDSSISPAEESSQADPREQGSVRSQDNPSPPGTMVGGCIEPGHFTKRREGLRVAYRHHGQVSPVHSLLWN